MEQTNRAGSIWVEPETLQDNSSERLRPGAIYALHRLDEVGYTLRCNTPKLLDSQKTLLSHEGIEFESDARDNADWTVASGRDNVLEIHSKDSAVAEGGNWRELVNRFLFPRRAATRKRTTAETEVEVTLNVDGTGECDIDTGLKFFDHMLEQIGRHGLVDLTIRCRGDLEIDEHHTIEDVAITLGEALHEACLQDKTGILRYGFLLAMDEAQAEVALDLSNRPWLVWDVQFTGQYAGDFPLQMAKHFFHTLAMNLKATLQIRAGGENDHHILESVFKGFARALRFAITRTERARNILPSSKGAL
ncbi:MAG: imidazoleglycerol-phosphate dehydratase HisB [Balneolaceae bacterium]